MKTTHDPALLKRIARATLRPCPAIRESRVYVENATGNTSSIGGACPRTPFHTETCGYVYYDDRNNTTYGKRKPTEHAARFSHHYHQCRSAVKFLRQLREMTADEVKFQRRYWLKDLPTPRKLPGFAA